MSTALSYSRRNAVHFSGVKRVFRLGETLATRLAPKITAYTQAFYVNRLLGRARGRVKDLGT